MTQSDNNAPATITKKEAIKQLWEAGCLYWKLDSNQESIYKFLEDNESKICIVSCSRRNGKSFMLVLMAFEYCLRNPGTIVKFIQPEVKMIKRDIRPLIREITKDCPSALKPEFRVHDNIYHFPNGSELQLAGSDNGNAESLRGGSAHLCIVDEAGFCSDLKYLVQSILLPTTTTTNGRIILSSTPPRTPDHEFVKFVEEAELKGNLITRTVYDNPRLSKEQIEEIMNTYPGGASDVQFRREYLCEFITSTEDAVVPEFTGELREHIVKESERPVFYDSYVSADIGFKDLTVVLFAYLDFLKGVLVVEDEIVVNGKKMTTDYLALEIKKKEAELWRDPVTKEVRSPLVRVCDNNLILINDLQQIHGITFIPTAKDNADAALNNMRMLLSQGKIIISPKCKTLISHLKSAVWNKARTSFDRSPDQGHYDAVDALKYLVRNVRFTKNPYPSDYAFFGKSSDDLFIFNRKPKTNSELEKWAKATFGGKKRN